jgi:histone H1/5
MSYKAGIIESIQELKDRTGSSMIAIKKLMQEKLPKDKKWMNATFLSSLKKGVADGEFVQIKNSYKLSADFKKALTKKAAPPKKKAAPKKATTTTKKTATKKTTAPKKVSPSI